MKKKFMLLIGLMALSALIPANSVHAKTESVSTVYDLTITHPHPVDFFDYVIADFQSWFATTFPGDTVNVVSDAQAGSFQGPDKIIGWNGSGVASDILWGGGTTEFDRLVLNPGLNLLQRYRVPDFNNFSAYLSAWPLYDPSAQGCDTSTCSVAPSWYGAALSGFGFIYNYERLAQLGLPIPVTWDDLADFRYFGEIISTNPSTSGSTNANFLQMLQFKTSQHSESTINASTDSTEAWEFWDKVAGNVGEWPSSSSATPNAVADGQYSIGLTIDFFAFSRRETFPVGFSYGGATAVSADPVGMLLNAPDTLAAQAFMDYITSARGQSRVGKYRTPVNMNATSVYPIARAFNWDGTPTGAFPAIDPYDQALYDLVYDETRAMVNNWFVANAPAQRDAWEAINTAQNATAKDQALATYLKLPTGFNGTIQSLEDLDQTNTTQTAGWLADGAANFALAKTQAQAPPDVSQPSVTTITLPGGQTTVSTISISTTTQSAVPGFIVLVVIPSFAGMVLLKRRRK